MILQIIVDYLVLLGGWPQAFGQGASDREFDVWRQGILQSLHAILEHINTNLDRMDKLFAKKRLEENGEQKVKNMIAKHGLENLNFKQETLRSILAIVFFTERSNASPDV